MTRFMPERKLVAIVSADVAGYSRLMSLDEVGTVQTLTEYRDELGSLVEKYRGRVVDTPGDNALVEFPSATAAVECAIEFQDVIAKRNIDVPTERRMEFRIGIHLGEVMLADDRIYGEGVNVAARLEAMAPVGGICLSQTVRDQVASNLDATFIDLGEQSLKNIPQPVQVYRLDHGGSEGTAERAVVSAGVEGLSQLITDDEEGTFAALKAHRTAVDPLVYSHGGRIIGTETERILFEFPSVAEAVKCSAEVQALMAQRNAMMPEGRRMYFLLGIDVGDVAEVEGQLEGDTVTAASRLMQISEPGGVCLSDRVRRLVTDLEVDFVDGGIRQLNGGRQSRVWRLSPRTASSPPSSSGGQGAIVVLPFERLGNDPDQDYLVDGITEDVTTALTSYREFRVLPRGSAFAYRDQSKTNREIARELDATYVLRGSVRASSDRVRVSVELIDAEADQVLWAERFDRELEDVFDLQDEIARSITLKLAPELAKGELDKSVAKGPDSLESWDLFQRGKWHYYRTTPGDYEKSIDLLQEAIDKDPNNALAMSFLSFVLIIRVWSGWSSDAAGDYQRATLIGERAVRTDDSSWRAHSSLALVYAFTGQHDRALQEAELSMPWSPAAVGTASWLAGDIERGIEYTTLAVQLSPGDQANYHWRVGLAYMHYMKGNYPGALVWAEQAMLGLPDYLQLKGLMAATLAELGRDAEARRYMDEFLEQLPGATAATYRTGFRFRNQAHVDSYIQGLVKAGLPES